MLTRLLNLLEQHVGGAFQHAIDIFDNDDAPRRSAWHLLGSGDDVSHLVDADGHFVGGQHGHVAVSYTHLDVYKRQSQSIEEVWAHIQSDFAGIDQLEAAQ